jgi:hypothetical protein
VHSQSMGHLPVVNVRYGMSWSIIYQLKACKEAHENETNEEFLEYLVLV